MDSLIMVEEIGKVKMAQAVSSSLNLTVIRWFSAMKESGSYKNKLLIGPGNIPFRPENFEQLCEGMGFSKSTIHEYLQNFAALGERCLSEAQELGLKVRDLRKVRKALKDAPEEKKQEVLAAIRSAKESTPEELKSAIDVICEQLSSARGETKKLTEQIKKLKTDSEELRKDYEARGQVLEAKSAQYQELNEKYIRVISPHPSDVEILKLTKNQTARKELDSKCNEALLAVSALAAQGAAILSDETIDDDTAAYVHRRLSLAIKDMAARILGAGIDVDLTTEFTVDFGIEDGSETYE